MSTATTKKTTARSTKSDILKENEELRERLAKVEEEKELEFRTVNIRPDEYIPVVSLCPNPLNLSTSKYRGKQFRFAKMGDIKHIMYEYLVEIIENHYTFAESGLFYILNKDVVSRHGLTHHYDNVLTGEEIEEIVSTGSPAALEIFSSANSKQQGYIADMIESRMVNGEDVDMNFVHRVSELIGRNIIERVENTKAVIGMDNAG